MDYQKAFYLCKAEAEQRQRDIHRIIDMARNDMDLANYHNKLLDGLASIAHHSEMTVFAFTQCEKAKEENDYSEGSVMDGMAKLRRMTERLLEEVK